MKRKPAIRKPGHNAFLAEAESASRETPMTIDEVMAHVSRAVMAPFLRHFNEVAPKKPARNPKKKMKRPYIEDHPTILELEAEARFASPTARSGIAGAVLLQKNLLRTLGYKDKPQPKSKKTSRPHKLVLHIGDEEDRERYRRLLASATDRPRSSDPVMGRCCSERHKKSHTHKTSRQTKI